MISRKFTKNLLLPALILCLFPLASLGQENTSTQIAILGTFHFSQIHKSGNELTDFFSKRTKEQVYDVLGKLKIFRPDQIYIEREPGFQPQIDSLYRLYKNNKLKLEELENGAGEVYQLAFRLAKELNLEAPKCVNHYESTSQSLLASGKNIEKYQNALKEFQNLGRSVVGKFLKGEATLLETLFKMNLPENVSLSHRLLFNVPAYVTDGEFLSYEKIDKETIDKRYIGAEFISLFYERNLKIYSNILNTQLQHNDQRILFITGQVHVGVLQDLLRKNNHFKVIESSEILINNK
ncbi:DUF5694 domain-containing protein [Ascidiimonas aurantiaca]|uniref:DUF5694 domain-containing protein n=1 Tax=Ascidiimonas aurantiaca TaxID=1685432 RepID=UPI0030ED4F5F